MFDHRCALELWENQIWWIFIVATLVREMSHHLNNEGLGTLVWRKTKKNLKRQKVDVLVVFVYVFKLQLTFGEKTKKQLESERILARSIFRISVWNWEKRILENEEFTWYGRLLYREVSKITSFHQQNNLTLTRQLRRNSSLILQRNRFLFYIKWCD